MQDAIASLQQLPAEIPVGHDPPQVVANDFDARPQSAQVAQSKITDVQYTHLMAAHQKLGDQHRPQVPRSARYQDLHRKTLSASLRDSTIYVISASVMLVKNGRVTTSRASFSVAGNARSAQRRK